MRRDAASALMRRGAGKVLMLLALGACGQHDEATGTPAPVTAPAVARIPTGAPHGGTVTTVAITDEADAALSADHLGGVRLWPSLDGKRPPIPISSVAPSQLALTHVPVVAGLAGQPPELLAAILDQAGTVRLLRLAPDGVVRARFQLPNDVACEEVIAIDGGMLVRRADQSLEKFDANGRSRGKLVTEPGERLTAIASRHGSVIAIIATTKAAGANTLRWILSEGDLRWGTTVTLPVVVQAASIALSPNHRRIAVRGMSPTSLAVFDLVPLPKAVVGHTLGAADLANTPADLVFGFTDDDHVAMSSTTINWWNASPGAGEGGLPDPWATTPPSTPPPRDGQVVAGSIGDGLVVTAQGGALALTNPSRTRYLGWTDLANGTAASIGHRIAYTINGARVIWLDDHLERVREVNFSDVPGAVGNYGIAVGEHHVAVATNEGAETGVKVKVIDLDDPTKPLVIRTSGEGEGENNQFVYVPDLNILVLTGGMVARRFAIDLARGTVLELPSLTSPFLLSTLVLTDPARAGGVIAVGVGTSDDGTPRLLTFRQDAKAKTIKPTTSTKVDAEIVAVDKNATIFTRPSGPAIIATRGGKQVGNIPLSTPADVISVRRDGARIAIIEPSRIVLVDLNGVVLWQQSLWGALSVTFTADERRLLVQTAAGIISLSATTGERVQAVCAWGFGLYDHPINQAAFGVATVCED